MRAEKPQRSRNLSRQAWTWRHGSPYNLDQSRTVATHLDAMCFDISVILPIAVSFRTPLFSKQHHGLVPEPRQWQLQDEGG
jgi:hypothetical protein